MYCVLTYQYLIGINQNQNLNENILYLRTGTKSDFGILKGKPKFQI